ncbi:hypothetical protein EVAR_12146_1 [Eumeta japonica]|uniref:DUF4780 domain-containing protein n=1 Tax=Eumeta variegata TaxID=151549 RepID=A0A4C1UH79_EUMVA|nr:hypothetical protein EVAR_12146_1 [Eumeta japonica]
MKGRKTEEDKYMPRKMIEKRVNNIICKKNMNLLEIQHKFRLTYSIQDEEKMLPMLWQFIPKGIMKDSCHESNEFVHETFNLYLCKDDFSAISTVEADTIRQFLVSKIFDATASSASNGWVPNFIMRGLSSLCRYEVETNDRLSKIWLEQFDFSDLGGIHIVVYNKEELWYERGAIWLPGHSACKNVEPLDKLRLQNRHMSAIDLNKWKLVKKIVTSLGTRIYVDMPPASARALESQVMMLSYELQKVSVFLKTAAVDKDTFDAGLRERSIDDTTELMTAIRKTPMPYQRRPETDQDRF